MDTWNSGSWTIPASFCSSFFSILAVSIPLLRLKPCKASCRMMVIRSLFFTIETQIFQTTSTNPMPLYLSPGCLSWNATFVILTILSQLSLSGSFYLINSLTMSSGVLPSFPMFLLSVLPVVSALKMQSSLLPEARL